MAEPLLPIAVLDRIAQTMATFRQQNGGFCGCAPVPYPADTLAQLKSFIKENLATYDSDENTSAESIQPETGHACASADECTDEHKATSFSYCSVEEPLAERRMFVATGGITLHRFTNGDNATSGGSPEKETNANEMTTSVSSRRDSVGCISNVPSSARKDDSSMYKSPMNAPTSFRRDQFIAAAEVKTRCYTQAKLVLAPPLMSLAAKVNDTFVARRHVSISLSESGSDAEVGSQCSQDTTVNNVAQAIERLERAYTRDRMRHLAAMDDNGRVVTNTNVQRDNTHSNNNDYHRSGNILVENVATRNVDSAIQATIGSATIGHMDDNINRLRHHENTAETVHAHHRHCREATPHHNDSRSLVTEHSNHRNCRGEGLVVSGDTNRAAFRNSRSRDNMSTDEETTTYCRPRYYGRRRRQHINVDCGSPVRLTVRQAAASLERGDFGVRTTREHEERPDGPRRIRRYSSWHDDNDDGYTSPDTVSSDASDTSSMLHRIDSASGSRTRGKLFSNNAMLSPKAINRDATQEELSPQAHSGEDADADIFGKNRPTSEHKLSRANTFREDAARYEGSVSTRRTQQSCRMPRDSQQVDTTTTPGKTNLKRSASMKTHFGYVDRGTVPSFRRMNAILRRHSCRETPVIKADDTSVESRIKALLKQSSEDEMTSRDTVQRVNEGTLLNRPPLRLFSGKTEGDPSPLDSSSIDPTASRPSCTLHKAQPDMVLESRASGVLRQPDATGGMDSMEATSSRKIRPTQYREIEAQCYQDFNLTHRVTTSVPPTDFVVFIPTARLELLPTDSAVYHNIESSITRKRPDTPPSPDNPQGGPCSNSVHSFGANVPPLEDNRRGIMGVARAEVMRSRADVTQSSVGHTVNAPMAGRLSRLKADTSDPRTARPPPSPSQKRVKATPGSRAGKRALERVSSVHLKVNSWLNRQDRISASDHVSDTDSDRTWPLFGRRLTQDHGDTYISPADTRKVLHKVDQMRRNSFRRGTESANSWPRRVPPRDVGGARSRPLLSPPDQVVPSAPGGGNPATQCGRSSPSGSPAEGTESSCNRSLSSLDGAMMGSDKFWAPPFAQQKTSPCLGLVSRSAESSQVGTPPVSQHDANVSCGTQSPSLDDDRSLTRNAVRPVDVYWRRRANSNTPPLRLASDMEDWLETIRTGRLPNRTHSLHLAAAQGRHLRMTSLAKPTSTSLSERDFPAQHALFSSC